MVFALIVTFCVLNGHPLAGPGFSLSCTEHKISGWQGTNAECRAMAADLQAALQPAAVRPPRVEFYRFSCGRT